MRPSRTLLLLAVSAATAAARTVLLTGATGRTGKEAYVALKTAGLEVRALVRNATKAQAELGCQKCDASEGIFVGDVTKPDTLKDAMAGADTLVITTGPVTSCFLDVFNCHYLPGASPKEVNWEGLRAQLRAFASSPGSALKDRHVVLMSTALTTKPDNFLDKIGGGDICFWSLNGEAYLMASGLPFTIVKACGLSDGTPEKNHLVVGHDDSLNSFSMVRRSDVARVLATAASRPDRAAGLRFDMCAAWFGQPTEDPVELFQQAMYSWDPRKGGLA